MPRQCTPRGRLALGLLAKAHAGWLTARTPCGGAHDAWRAVMYIMMVISSGGNDDERCTCDGCRGGRNVAVVVVPGFRESCVGALRSSSVHLKLCVLQSIVLIARARAP